MKVTRLAIPDVLLIEPRVFGDARGFFFESFNARVFRAETGLDVDFVQDNHSRSSKGVLRGLHYQMAPHAQGKLVRAVRGEVFDVAVDLRKSSATFGKWVGAVLSEVNHHQMWIPPGFAHGFIVLSETADFIYKTTDYYVQAAERTILWSDTLLGIHWPIDGSPLLSTKDATADEFSEVNYFP